MKATRLAFLSLACSLIAACGDTTSDSAGTAGSAQAGNGGNGQLRGGESGTAGKSGESGAGRGAGGAEASGRSGAGGAGAAMGGAASGAAGTIAGAGGESGPSTSCDSDFTCPDIGQCSLRHEGSRCVRHCSVSKLLLESDEDIARLANYACEEIEGSLQITGSPSGAYSTVTSLAGLETIRTVTGLIYVDATKLVDIGGLSGLETVGGLDVNRTGVLSIELPALTNVESGDLQLISLPKAKTIVAPKLENVAGSFKIVSCGSLSEVQMDALATVDKLVIGENRELLTVHELPSLVSVRRDVSIEGNTRLPQCEADAIFQRIGKRCSSACLGNDAAGSCQ